jgi:hypothetical protein
VTVVLAPAPAAGPSAGVAASVPVTMPASTPSPRRRPLRATEPPAPPAAASRALAMRRPGLDLRLPPAHAVSPGTLAPPPSGAPQPAGEDAVIRDGDSGPSRSPGPAVFTRSPQGDAPASIAEDSRGSLGHGDITVAPDGSAKVARTPLARARIVVPVKGLGRLLDEWWKEPDKFRRRGPPDEQALEWQAKDPSIEHHQDVAPNRPATAARVAGELVSNLVVPRIVGSTDLTDLALAAAGKRDPYEARKLAALDATRDERAARGARHREEQQARATQLMRRNLQALWARPLSAAERRAALFALWDECADGEAGELARRAVVGWIRAHLPEGSAGGFPAGELERLNAARSSRQRFEPYGRNLAP